MKITLAEKYNISVSQINEIINENNMLAVYSEKVPSKNSYNISDQKKLSLYLDLKKSIGDENFKTFENKMITDVNKKITKAINKEVDDTIRDEIDDAIKEAITDAISMAALQAGWDALISALMSGASWAEALAAGEKACGYGC
mgnify:CR=1 FL=1